MTKLQPDLSASFYLQKKKHILDISSHIQVINLMYVYRCNLSKAQNTESSFLIWIFFLNRLLLTYRVCLLQRVKEPLRQVDHRADIAKQPIKVHILHL